MVVSPSEFRGLSASLGKGLLCDEVVLDIARIMNRKTEKREYNPKELYSKALDILIDKNVPRHLIKTCKSLRDNRLILLPDYLEEMSVYFTQLSKKELIKTESYFPKC